MDRSSKRVVFIGSCSFSGSTALDLIIGTADDAISLGEIGLAYYPQREVHILRECGCMDKSCDYWDEVVERPEEGVHLRALKKHGASLLSDSTKDPFWIRRCSEELEKNGVEVVNILLWRHPEEVRKSFEKRGRGPDWQRHWVNYHRLYFSLVRRFMVLPFESIYSDDDELKSRLQRIGITNFTKKFWDVPTHSLFGNVTAKKSLFPFDSENYLKLLSRQKMENGGRGEHRVIFEADTSKKGTQDISKRAADILQFLENNDVKHCEEVFVEPPASLRMGRIGCLVRRSNRRLRSWFRESFRKHPTGDWGA